MDGNCNVESIIYQAEVTTETAKEKYIGLFDTAFKLRWKPCKLIPKQALQTCYRT